MSILSELQFPLMILKWVLLIFSCVQRKLEKLIRNPCHIVFFWFFQDKEEWSFRLPRYRKNWSMKTIKNQLFHVYSLTRFIDDSNSLNIPFSFYRIGADILETIISSSPPVFFSHWLRKMAGHRSAERAFRETFISAWLPNGASLLFSLPRWNSTAGLPECFIVRVPFKRAQRSRVSWLLPHWPFSTFFSSSRDLRPASLEKGQETLRLRVYACYAWGGPLLVAGLAALLDHLPPQPQYTFLRPRFGVKQCWFYGKFIFLSSFNNKNNNNSCGEDLSNFLLCRRRRFPLCETL